MTDITTRTPADIDAELADLGGRAAECSRRVERALESIHSIVDTKTVISPRTRYSAEISKWAMSDAEAVQHATTFGAPKPWETDYLTKALRTLAEQSNELAEWTRAMAPLNTEYVRRGRWARFYLVTSSNGLIHSSTNCSTCNNGRGLTQFAWMTDQSGQTTAEAVAAKGPYLCQTCFPDAKAEWRRTPAEVKAEQAAADPTICPGSGKVGTDLQLQYNSPRGRCSVCGTHQSPNRYTGKIRKHKVPTLVTK